MFIIKIYICLLIFLEIIALIIEFIINPYTLVIFKLEIKVRNNPIETLKI